MSEMAGLLREDGDALPLEEEQALKEESNQELGEEQQNLEDELLSLQIKKLKLILI